MFSSESRCPLGNIDSRPPRAEIFTMCFGPSRAHLFDEIRFQRWQFPNRRSDQKNPFHPLQAGRIVSGLA